MCTIGNTITADNGNVSFKQCDLKDATNFLEPKVTQGEGDISYYPFLRDGSKGPWAGINSYGVSFVAADSYLAFDDQQAPTTVPVSEDIFEAYTKILSANKSAESAKDYMVDFYKSFPATDILLITDSKTAWFIEANNGSVACIERTDGHFECTNHMRMLYQGVPYSQNHSSYLRLERAQEILENNPSASGPLEILNDQYFGESVFSICRVNGVRPPQEEPYYTQATAILLSTTTGMTALFQLNGNPRTNTFTLVRDIFGKQSIQEGLKSDQLNDILTKQ